MKNKATKNEIINSVAENSSFSKYQTKLMLNLILGHIRLLLTTHDKIEIRGFGVFEARMRNARDNARNPKTGETVSLPARRVICFRPGKSMRRSIPPFSMDNKYTE